MISQTIRLQPIAIMPKSQHLITIAFAAGVLLTDQFHRLASLSSPTLQRTQSTDFEFLPLELIRALNTTNHAITSDDDEYSTEEEDDTEEDEYESNDEDETPTKKSFKTKHKKFPWSLPNISPHHTPKSSKQFMSELNTIKRAHNITLPWEHSSPLPHPIVSYNLPKSATLTTKEYFACGGIVSSHTFVPFSQIRIGDCMRDNFVRRFDPFNGCNGHPKLNRTIEFYSDVGIQIGTKGRACWYNSLNDGGLEHVARYYPNLTIFMVPRNATAWVRSVSQWGGGRLFSGWKKRCGFKGSIGDYSDADWESFYHAHTEKIRQFALKNLHITYVEVELETEDSAEMMEYYTGIDRICLQHCFPGKPKDPNVDMKTYQKCKPVNATS